MATGLVDSGINVVAVDQNVSALAALATALAGRRGSVLTHAADLTQAGTFEGIAAAAQERVGRSDILVNNAGIGQASVLQGRACRAPTSPTIRDGLPIRSCLIVEPESRRRRQAWHR
jgi:NAD(P)-dependent dehydrogenase (short-subunit alcohol dehydrogenase family)